MSTTKTALVPGYAPPPEPEADPDKWLANERPTEKLDDEQKALAQKAFTKRPLTDSGNATRFAEQHSSQVRYCYDEDCWYVFDGQRWATDKSRRVVRWAIASAKSIYNDASRATTPEIGKAIASWAQASQSSAKLVATISLARSHQDIATPMTAFDTDPDTLNTPSGTVHLPTAALRRHAAKDLISHITEVGYDPKAGPPIAGLAWLREMMDDHQEKIDFLQKVIGYSLTGHTRSDKVFIHYGEGRNGKTTLITGFLKHILGDYAAPAAAETFTASRWGDEGGKPDPQLHALVGTRLVVASEWTKGAVLNEKRIKAISGGERIPVRTLHKEVYNFDATFKVQALLNNDEWPTIKGTSEGSWSRIVPVFWPISVPEELRDTTIRDRIIKDEAAQWLWWAVEGAKRWYQEDFTRLPASVIADREARRTSQTSMVGGDFVIDETILDETSLTSIDGLYARYLLWATERHQGVMSKIALGKILRKRYSLTDDKAGGVRVWVGIRLRELDDGPAFTPASSVPDLPMLEVPEATPASGTGAPIPAVLDGDPQSDDWLFDRSDDEEAA
jgi:putative DNA primase/helicase